MLIPGSVVVKIAGRDARGVGVVVEIIDDYNVLVEGALRRKKVNIRHLEPLGKKIEISKDASKREVLDKLKEAKLITEEQYKEWLNKGENKKE